MDFIGSECVWITIGSMVNNRDGFGFSTTTTCIATQWNNYVVTDRVSELGCIWMLLTRTKWIYIDLNTFDRIHIYVHFLFGKATNRVVTDRDETDFSCYNFEQPLVVWGKALLFHNIMYWNTTKSVVTDRDGELGWGLNGCEWNEIDLDICG